ncbi:MAG: alpha-L-fucosidase [Lentisphaeria bacterium]|nr:alpha-L-fucosidase [Lentisphaeria bacterium]
MMRIETRMGVICLLTMLVMVANTWLAAGETRAPAKPKESAKLNTVKALQTEFLKLKFGMFIHYNMATYVGREWVDGYADPATFDPGGPIDTDAWADAAKAAGMTYAVLTTKHVGGFCLWDSKYTTYDVMHPDCPVKEDIVGKFVKSFTSRGLKVGLYYCWRHPGFPEKNKVLPPECDPATHSIDEQIDFQKKQIAELVEKYPEVFYIWNDALDPDLMPAEDATAFMRTLGPTIIGCGNWWDWKKKGSPYLDIVVSELRHLSNRHLNNKTVGETCWCLEPKWFHSGGPTKNAANIVQQLQTANSRNANFLLNVGPDKQGRIHPDSLKVLTELGELLGENGEVNSTQ